MTDSPAAIGLGFLAYFALTLLLLAAAAVWRHRDARRVPATTTGGATGQDQHCQNNGHWYRKAFADMWRCVNCGHLQPVSAEDVLDAAAEDFRGELAHVEAFANGEVTL